LLEKKGLNREIRKEGMEQNKKIQETRNSTYIVRLSKPQPKVDKRYGSFSPLTIDDTFK
jgi:hypothetical protein